MPTWDNAIEPIYQSKCALCHEPSVTTFPLHTKELWVDNIEEITLAVELGVMPLLPKESLTPDELESVHAWTMLGFPD